MSYTTPDFGIVVPSPSTRLNQLGSELQQMGISIEEVLKSFDYNGADPNTVLSRVTALETWRTTAAAKLAALEAEHVDTGWVQLNGWKAGTSTFSHVGGSEVRVRKIGDQVEIEGMLTNTTWSGGLTYANVTLPQHLRPNGVKMFDMPHNSTVRRLVYIRADGEIYLYANATAGTWWSFDQVRYRTD